MDMDTFFVSVERKLDSRLNGLPVIIGGSSQRGVVASCSYEARQFGVHSAMPMRLALRLCPHAKVISGDMEAYNQHSRAVTEVIAANAPLFEKASIDEFYLDVSGMDRFFGCYQWGQALKQQIVKETGLPVSFGLASNKMVSKIATGDSKPNGQREIPRGMEKHYLAPMSINKIPMIGQKTAAFLNQLGVYDVRTLAAMPREVLQRTFGKNGISLWYKAHGIDLSPVVPYYEQKSVSTETTFDTDSIDVKKMKVILTAMVEKLGYKLRTHQRLASCITVKLRYANFDTVTHQLQISYTANDQTLLKYAHELFDKLYNRRMLIRLIGVRLSKLVHGCYQIHLFDDTRQQIQLHQALDYIRSKHGVKKIVRASTMGIKEQLREDNNMFSKD